jgi:hypothetical protein
MPAWATVQQTQTTTVAKAAAFKTLRRHAGFRLARKPSRLPENQEVTAGAGTRARQRARSIHPETIAATQSQTEYPDGIDFPLRHLLLLITDAFIGFANSTRAASAHREHRRSAGPPRIDPQARRAGT